MQTEFGSVTERFQEMVDNSRVKSVDICWQRFGNHLVERDFFSQIPHFHRWVGDSLKEEFHLWMEKGPTSLLDPQSLDIGASFFREFMQLPEVIAAAEDFIQKYSP